MKHVGFSVGDTIKLYWLFKAQHGAINPKQLYDEYTQQFPGRKMAYDYMARIAKKLTTEGLLTVSLDKNKKMYITTSKGKDVHRKYENLYYEQFSEIQRVLQRLYFHLTKNCEQPPLPDKQLPNEFRAYFAKLMSVKDIVRYMVFSLGQTRTEFYVAEVNEQLQFLFGWSPSNAYLYEIAREMEAEGTIKGHWKEPDKRTIRVITVTDEGVVFAKQVTKSLTESVKETLHHINYIMYFIRES